MDTNDDRTTIDQDRLYHVSSYKLVGILQGLAPNGTAQQVVSHRFHELCDTMQPKQVLAVLADDLRTGLLSGAWPWTGHQWLGGSKRTASIRTLEERTNEPLPPITRPNADSSVDEHPFGKMKIVDGIEVWE